MSKSETLRKLKGVLGLPETEEFDPVIFSLKLGKNIEKIAAEIKVNQEKVNEGLDAFGKSQNKELQKQFAEMMTLQTELLKAIKDRRVEKVEVERVIERAPETVKVDFKIPDQKNRDTERRGLFDKVKDAVGNVASAIQTIIEEIRFSRDPEGALAVRLVDAKGKDFYNALLSIAGGGGGSTLVDPVLTATHVSKTVDFTASQTKQTIWTPANGYKFVITDYHLSFSAAGAITVFDGETDNAAGRVVKYNGANNGGANHAYKKPRISSAADNKLYYTTGAGAAGSLTVEGYETK